MELKQKMIKNYAESIKLASINMLKTLELYADDIEESPHPTDDLAIKIIIEMNDQAIDLAKNADRLLELGGDDVSGYTGDE